MGPNLGPRERPPRKPTLLAAPTFDAECERQGPAQPKSGPRLGSKHFSAIARGCGPGVVTGRAPMLPRPTYMAGGRSVSRHGWTSVRAKCWVVGQNFHTLKILLSTRHGGGGSPAEPCSKKTRPPTPPRTPPQLGAKAPRPRAAFARFVPLRPTDCVLPPTPCPP